MPSFLTSLPKKEKVLISRGLFSFCDSLLQLCLQIITYCTCLLSIAFCLNQINNTAVGHALVLPARRDLPDFLKNVLTCHVCLGKVLPRGDSLSSCSLKAYHPDRHICMNNHLYNNELELNEASESLVFTTANTARVVPMLRVDSPKQSFSLREE